MPIGQVIGEQNVYNADPITGVSYTFNAPPAVGSHLLVTVLSAFGGGTWSYKDSQGNTPVQDQPQLVGGDAIGVQIFRVPVLTTGPNYTITLTPNASGTYADICAIEVPGLTSSPFDQSATAKSNPAVTITSPALSQAQEFVICAYVCDSNAQPDGLTGPGSPWTPVFVETNGGSWPVGGVVYQFVNSTAPVSATWSPTSGVSGAAMLNTYKMAPTNSLKRYSGQTGLGAGAGPFFQDPLGSA